MAQHSDIFIALCKANGIPAPDTEHKFHPTRRWRFDYAWIEQRIALEVEGGVWIGGRHTSGAGFVKDMEKYNEAACLGWRVIRCQPKQLASGAMIDTIQRAMQCQ